MSLVWILADMWRYTHIPPGGGGAAHVPGLGPGRHVAVRPYSALAPLSTGLPLTPCCGSIRGGRSEAPRRQPVAGPACRDQLADPSPAYAGLLPTCSVPLAMAGLGMPRGKSEFTGHGGQATLSSSHPGGVVVTPVLVVVFSVSILTVSTWDPP